MCRNVFKSASLLTLPSLYLACRLPACYIGSIFTSRPTAYQPATLPYTFPFLLGSIWCNYTLPYKAKARPLARRCSFWKLVQNYNTADVGPPRPPRREVERTGASGVVKPNSSLFSRFKDRLLCGCRGQLLDH
eukprot:243158-Chlamydomonas_euryale.AAC.1